MKLAFLDPLEARLLDFPKTYLGDHEVIAAPERGVLPEGVDDAEAIAWWSYPVDGDLIGRLPRLRFLQRMTASILSNGRLTGSFGMAGGSDGQPGRNFVERADGRVEALGHIGSAAMEPGDVFVIETPGGGGYGAA